MTKRSDTRRCRLCGQLAYDAGLEDIEERQNLRKENARLREELDLAEGEKGSMDSYIVQLREELAEHKDVIRDIYIALRLIEKPTTEASDE